MMRESLIGLRPPLSVVSGMLLPAQRVGMDVCPQPVKFIVIPDDAVIEAALPEGFHRLGKN